MARYSTGARTGAGSTTLPIISIYSSATQNGSVKEIGVFNTTSTAVALKLVRLTTAGTKGTTITSGTQDTISPAAQCVVSQTHTVAPTGNIDLGYNVTLGAAVGSGIIWTFEALSTGLAAVTNGIGVIVATGTGQVCDAYIVWQE